MYPHTGPLPPGELAIEDFGSTTITVSWGPALNELATGYELVATPITGGGQGQIRFANVGLDRTQTTFTGLEPGTEYRITLDITNVADTPTQISQFTRKLFS